MNHKLTGAAMALLTATSALNTDACTRVLYKGTDSLFVVARSLDWKSPIPTNLYVYPRGMQKQGASTPEGGINWTSRYGAIYAVGYDGGVTEGMNEKGLIINGLYCKGTVYNNPSTADKPLISMAMFIPWMLDNCATTEEVVALVRDQNFRIEGAKFDGGNTSTLHWGITDVDGNSAILEFDNGRIRIYDPGDYRALTNDPQWPDMQAILEYWTKIGGKNMLPGTVSSPDRCVRANFFSHHVEQTSDTDLGVSIARSILVTCCVPYSYMFLDEPNVSSTQWRSYAVARDKRYYFDIVTNPGVYYIDLNEVNLNPGAPVMKLDTGAQKNLCGNATAALRQSPPFTPMY